jgi:hypothetical protein
MFTTIHDLTTITGGVIAASDGTGCTEPRRPGGPTIFNPGNPFSLPRPHGGSIGSILGGGTGLPDTIGGRGGRWHDLMNQPLR